MRKRVETELPSLHSRRWTIRRKAAVLEALHSGALEAKRDAVLKALVTETDPKIQRKLRASARRYKAMIAMGPERTRAASSHPQYAQRYPLGEIKQRD